MSGKAWSYAVDNFDDAKVRTGWSWLCLVSSGACVAGIVPADSLMPPRRLAVIATCSCRPLAEAAPLNGIGIVHGKCKHVTFTVHPASHFHTAQEITTPLKDGWGITSDGTHLIVGDSSEKLYWLDPDTLEVARTVTVTGAQSNAAVWGAPGAGSV